MQLWACGFNAWNQLQCDGERDLTSNPQDVVAFQRILQAESIEVLKTSLSSTLIQTPSGLKATGSPGGLTKFCAETNDGLQMVSEAGNGKLVACANGALTEYSSLEKYKIGEGDVLRHFDRLQQLESNQTTFTALTSKGTVYTWGDGRYESCLARQVSENCQASTPCLVEDLLDLPTGRIRKISTGGYVTAAVTIGNDLYIWGGRPGQPKLLEQMEGYPTPVDLEGLDILDIAVGDNHMLALSTDHRLFVVGAGENGQLGLGANIKKLQDWREVSLPLTDSQKMIEVYAGYKNSFVVVG